MSESKPVSDLSAPVRKLPSGTVIPTIGFGVYLIPVSETAKAVEKALDMGYRLIDSATAYNNEAQCCEGILNFLEKRPDVKRSDIFYTSKVWETDYGYDAAKAAIERSLSEVAELEYIDLYLIHSAHGGKELRLDTYRALQEAQEAGKLKHIGVSNWGVPHLKELLEWPDLRVKPVVDQIEFNPWLQHRDIFEFCKQHGIFVEAFSPLTISQKFQDPQLLKLAEKYGKSPAQIMLRWSIQSGAIPLPKTVHTDRMRENLDIFDFEMSESDFKSLGDPEAYYLSTPHWDPTVAK